MQGLREEYEADCVEAEEKAEQFAEKVKEGERLKGERKRWIKDQLEWTKTPVCDTRFTLVSQTENPSTMMRGHSA
jgi:hypothetical protein